VPWVFFDLNGTLMDLGGLAEPLGGDPELVLGSLDDAVAQAMVATIAGEHGPFSDLLGAALRRRLAWAGADPALAERALERLAFMPPHPEAAPALDRLAAAGVPLGVLTQSTTQSAEAVLEAAGLRDRFEHVIGTDQVGAFKPDRRVYDAAAERAGVPVAEVWLVAAHWWDVAGAKHAGLRTAWIARRERQLLDSVPEPDVRAGDLAEAAERIAALA
jgi:2-haloacid dehalogenase